MNPAARHWLTALDSHQRADGGEAPRRPLMGPPPWAGALVGLLLAAIVLLAVACV